MYERDRGNWGMWVGGEERKEGEWGVSEEVIGGDWG